MRREYVETISSHAAPSPARHLLTISAPSPTVTAVATPTSRPFKVPPRLGPESAPRVGGQPFVSGHYDLLKGKVPAPAGRMRTNRRPPRLRATLRRTLTRALLACCDYYSL